MVLSCNTGTQAFSVNDFVTNANDIPTANVKDYAQCFDQALPSRTARGAGGAEITRVLSSDEEVMLELLVRGKCPLFGIERLLLHTFKLKSVSQTQIDVVDARLKDSEEAIRQSEVARAEDLWACNYAELQVRSLCGSNSYQVIGWELPVGRDFFRVDNVQQVQVYTPGLYLVALAVCNATTKTTALWGSDHLCEGSIRCKSPTWMGKLSRCLRSGCPRSRKTPLFHEMHRFHRPPRYQDGHNANRAHRLASLVEDTLL